MVLNLKYLSRRYYNFFVIFIESPCIKDPHATPVKSTPKNQTLSLNFVSSTSCIKDPFTTPVKSTTKNQSLNVISSTPCIKDPSTAPDKSTTKNQSLNIISSTPSSSKNYDFDDTSVFLNDDDSSMEFSEGDDVNDEEDCGSDIFMEDLSSTSVEVRLILLKMFL